jgi:hypothetical protein
MVPRTLFLLADVERLEDLEDLEDDDGRGTPEGPPRAPQREAAK